MKLRRLFWLFPLLLIFLVVVAIQEEFSKSNNDYQRIEVSNYDTDQTLSREERVLWSENPRDDNWQVYSSPEINEVVNDSRQKAVVPSCGEESVSESFDSQMISKEPISGDRRFV